MSTLIFGSCRTACLFLRCKNAVVYPGGHVHSPEQILQAFRVMRGDMVIPKAQERWFFRGCGYSRGRSLQVDLRKIDKVVMEISSVKSVWWKGRVLHEAYIDQVSGGNAPILDGATLKKDTYSQFAHNLMRIQDECGNRKIVAVCHTTLPAVPIRYRIAWQVSEWCRDNGHTFIDPNEVLAKLGLEEAVLKKPDGSNDYNHYTERACRALYQRILECLK